MDADEIEAAADHESWVCSEHTAARVLLDRTLPIEVGVTIPAGERL